MMNKKQVQDFLNYRKDIDDLVKDIFTTYQQLRDVTFKNQYFKTSKIIYDVYVDSDEVVINSAYNKLQRLKFPISWLYTPWFDKAKKAVEKEYAQEIMDKLKG